MYKIIILLLLIIPTISSNVNAFEIYGFIPWHMQKGNTLIKNQDEVKKNLALWGLQRIDVIYHNRMLTNGHVDSNKIKKIAINSQNHPEIPISFDLEIGNRNKPETVLPTLLKIINLYHTYDGKAPIGVYATLPQNTFGGSKLTTKRKQQLIKLNKQYEIIANKIDFISPVLYFYDGEDLNSWKKSVDFNLDQSKILAAKYNLKIYPYITNSFRMSQKNKKTGGWMIELLNQKQMYHVLTYLDQKGANGAIIWASSQVIDRSGSRLLITTNSPWVQGIKNFIK